MGLNNFVAQEARPPANLRFGRCVGKHERPQNQRAKHRLERHGLRIEQRQ